MSYDTAPYGAVYSRSDMERQKLHELRRVIKGLERVIVAFSGGVDSSLVSAVAFRELGDQATAAIAISPSLAPGDLKRAREVASSIGILLAEHQTDEVGLLKYQENTPLRCFFCKETVYGKFAGIAKAQNATIVDGFNLDDRGDARPGMRAAQKYGVRHPLYEAGMTKEDIRTTAKRLGLPNWDLQAQSCTSSRVLTGLRISSELLGRIQQAEAHISELLPESIHSTIRVRHLGDSVARIEVGGNILLAATDRLPEMTAALLALGYSKVTLAPYERGSANRKADL